MRTVHERLQAVLWNGTVGLTPLPHALPDGLITVRLADTPPGPVVLAWNDADGNPLIHSLVRLAVQEFAATGRG
ncbi:hypothetical protein [Streptosporangium sp. NPDC000396]|uniref:hypothetical protein n=1 Tax=Streptosporangium sp. NPDC000396 TaxID=3366185 RepID=UPI0036CD46CC